MIEAQLAVNEVVDVVIVKEVTVDVPNASCRKI